MIELYRKYFEHQCKQHPLLLHDPDNGVQVFRMVSIEEAFGDFKTQVKEKALFFRLIEPTWTLANQASNARQVVQGGFVIGQYMNTTFDGPSAKDAAADATERVALDMATKMVADSADGHPLFYYSIDDMDSLRWTAQRIETTGDGSYTGWVCMFGFQTHYASCLDSHTDDNWKTLTPHNL